MAWLCVNCNVWWLNSYFQNKCLGVLIIWVKYGLFNWYSWFHKECILMYVKSNKGGFWLRGLLGIQVFLMIYWCWFVVLEEWFAFHTVRNEWWSLPLRYIWLYRVSLEYLKIHSFYINKCAQLIDHTIWEFYSLCWNCCLIRNIFF